MIFGRFTDLQLPTRPVPDCTCCRCEEDHFESQMCDGCGYCKACCTCRLLEIAPEADESDECPFWDDDKRAGYWYAARARYIRLEVILEGEE